MQSIDTAFPMIICTYIHTCSYGACTFYKYTCMYICCYVYSYIPYGHCKVRFCKASEQLMHTHKVGRRVAVLHYSSWVWYGTGRSLVGRYTLQLLTTHTITVTIPRSSLELRRYITKLCCGPAKEHRSWILSSWNYSRVGHNVPLSAEIVCKCPIDVYVSSGCGGERPWTRVDWALLGETWMGLIGSDHNTCTESETLWLRTLRVVPTTTRHRENGIWLGIGDKIAGSSTNIEAKMRRGDDLYGLMRGWVPQRNVEVEGRWAVGKEGADYTWLKTFVSFILIYTQFSYAPSVTHLQSAL